MSSLLEKIKAILLATFTHAKNLAHFVIIYKSVLFLLKQIQPKSMKQFHTMVAAFFGGYFVFGSKNNINEQVISDFYLS